MFRYVILILLLLCALPAFSQTSENQGQKNQILLWKTPSSSKLLPDISLIGSFAAAYFRDDPSGDQGENPSRSRFNFQGIELGIQSVIDPYVRGDAFIHFGEHEVEVEEAFITTLSLPWNLQIRAGKMLNPFGRQNAQHLEQLNFVDYSLLNRYFLGADGLAELGVEISELLSVSWFSELKGAVLQGANEANFNGPRKGDLAYLGRWTNQFDLTQNLAMQTGLTGLFGFNDSAPGNSTQLYAADIYFRYKPSERRGLKWQSEYFLRRKELVGSTPIEGGLYSQIVYQFSKRWEAALRYDLVGLPAETVREQGLAPAVTFLATEFFRLRGQYEWIHERGANHDQHEAFLQLQFNMGPHGAHQF